MALCTAVRRRAVEPPAVVKSSHCSLSFTLSLVAEFDAQVAPSTLEGCKAELATYLAAPVAKNPAEYPHQRLRNFIKGLLADQGALEQMTTGIQFRLVPDWQGKTGPEAQRLLRRIVDPDPTPQDPLLLELLLPPHSGHTLDNVLDTTFARENVQFVTSFLAGTLPPDPKAPPVSRGKASGSKGGKAGGKASSSALEGSGRPVGHKAVPYTQPNSPTTLTTTLQVCRSRLINK